MAEFSYEQNAEKFPNFLKCLADFSNLERTALIQNASDKRIKDVSRFITLLRSGKIYVLNKKLFKRLAKYSQTMMALKIAAKNTKSKDKSNAFREILSTQHGLLGILGIYLETAIKEYELGINQINPITQLPRVIAKKRQKSIQKSTPIPEIKVPQIEERGEQIEMKL